MGGIKLKSGRISYQVINLAQLETDEKITSIVKRYSESIANLKKLLYFKLLIDTKY